ncbi:unnamed protein product [Polarella glacialis]|uniref:Glycerol-3-phosphate dehydrogenase NAD-dependent N-terminal domain-containing protein n=1 Tax=Polarella glacialis TaxID=89957 RepID=A0A813GL77_POLGL|nr:unnamed protein product [Polarella glacialis]
MHSSNGLLANIKLLASDLDGTLLNPDHRPAPGTFEAIAEYQAAGGTFAVCTGRDLGSARGVLKGLDIDSMPGVYLNGTTVKGKSGESLRAQTLPRSLLLKMVEWGRAHRKQASILFVAGDMHYVMDKSEEHALFMHRHLLDPEPLEVKGGYESAEPEIPSQVSMMRVICSPENMAVIRPEVAAAVAGQAAYAQSLPTTIDIMAPGTNKATGLHVLLQALGLSEAECCAIGDSENDLEMLQSVRVACAMGNAVKKTKAVSHFLLPKNEDDPSGVVCLLRRLTAALRSANATAAPEPWPGAPSRRLRVACFSSGSLGSCVARMVGQSVMRSAQFEEEMTMWVAEDEELEGQKLTEVINATRFDSKHMPGLRLPPNVKATSDAQAGLPKTP